MFGSVAAAGTLKLAQLADRYLPSKGTNEPELLGGDQPESWVARDSARVAERERR